MKYWSWDNSEVRDFEMKDFVGEVLTNIDVNEDGDEILLTTESGKQIRVCHYQDCCESVRIEDTNGDWHSLVGKPILAAEYDAQSEDIDYGSCTKTTLTFKVDDATVINRWYGESNGYYSESVTIEQILDPSNEKP